MITASQLAIHLEKTQKQVAEFIKNALINAHRDGIVVAVSGGIDSSVALAATVKALGPKK